MNVDARELALKMADFRLEAENAGESAGLVERARAADLEAFDQIMRLHEKQVLSTALRLLGNLEDAQDVAQEAFLRLYRNRSKVAGDTAEMRAWLYRVTVNLCNDAHRRRRRNRAEPLSGPDPMSALPDPELSVLELERSRLVEMALATLPDKERAAVVLRDLNGLSTREVAEILGSSEVTVRSQISVARGKLKKFTDRYLRKRI
jgi:RNA polymerase sigma-70 factor (ECF subfamily)